MFFALLSSFSSQTDFTKFVSEEIATARSRWRNRIPMPANPHHRSRCLRHEARAGIVAHMSCCLVRPSNGGLNLLVRSSHYQRARGEVFAVVPRWRAAWTRSLSVVISEAAAKHCFSLCLTEHPFQIQNLSIFRATQGIGPTDASLPCRMHKTSPPRASASLLVLQLYCCSTGFPQVWRTTLATLRTPTLLATTPHSLL